VILPPLVFPGLGVSLGLTNKLLSLKGVAVVQVEKVAINKIGQAEGTNTLAYHKH
jgi:hypothetical protein